MEIEINNTNWNFECRNIWRNITDPAVCFKVFKSIEEVKTQLWDVISDEIKKRDFYRWSCDGWICEWCTLN